MNRYTTDLFKSIEFEVSAEVNEINFWNNSDIWKISDNEIYPIWFDEDMLDVRRTIKRYYKNGLKVINAKYPSYMLRTLSRHLLNELKIIEIHSKSNGLRVKLDLEMQFIVMVKIFRNMTLIQQLTVIQHSKE
jgi:hypothetical protein